MPKKKVVKKQRWSTTQKWWWFACLLVFLIVGLSVQVVVHDHQRNQQAVREKEAFLVLERDMTRVSVGIREKIGTPKQEKITPYCQRTEYKFGGGYTFCGVELGGNISASSIDEAKGIAEKILESMGVGRFNLQSVTHEKVTDDRWSKNFYYDRVGESEPIPCSLDLSFLAHDINRTTGEPGEPQSETLAYLLRCNKDVVQPYYPMR